MTAGRPSRGARERAGDAVDPEERLDLLFRDLAVAPTGLAGREAARRLQQYGPNRWWLRSRDRPTPAAGGA